jgi:ABC-type lipoprotein export system ATPase subunit
LVGTSKVISATQPQGDLRSQPLHPARFHYLHLDDAGREGRDCRQGGARNRPAAEVPQRRGFELLEPDRSAETLSGGESQQYPAGPQIGSGLTGVTYVLDEPSIGLHQRDNDRLIGTLKHLRDIGNSVLVVEHDEDMIRAADHVIDMGPGAGIHAGRVMAQERLRRCRRIPDR